MCPLTECGYRKVSSACLSRNLSTFHKFSRPERLKIQVIHETRKPYTCKLERTAAKYKDCTSKEMSCPQTLCKVKRLKPHLTGKLHNIEDTESLR